MASRGWGIYDKAWGMTRVWHENISRDRTVRGSSISRPLSRKDMEYSGNQREALRVRLGEGKGEVQEDGANRLASRFSARSKSIAIMLSAFHPQPELGFGAAALVILCWAVRDGGLLFGFIGYRHGC